jgi:hypothetical protein
MTSPMKQHIPLMSAYLCQDCECVGNSATQCPACASSALLGLACVLNREEAMPAMHAAAYAFPSNLPSTLAA